MRWSWNNWGTKPNRSGLFEGPFIWTAKLFPAAKVLFAIRDPRAPETVVLKTVVRDADRRLAGVGFVLTDAARCAAHALGATRAISALQHDGSVARSLAGRAVVFRRYAVFAKELS